MVGPARPLGAAVDAVARSLISAAHGRRFVDAVAELLAARALVDEAGNARSLFVRDREHRALVAWPALVALVPAAAPIVLPSVTTPAPPGVSRVSMEIEVPAPKHAPPLLLRVSRGCERLELVYDDGGALTEVHPGAAGALPLLQRSDLEGRVTELELARMLAEGMADDPRRLLVRMPAATAEGLATAAMHGLSTLRRALFEGSVNDDDRVAIAVALEGGAVRGAATRDAALARVDDDVPAVLLALEPLPARIPGDFWEAGFHRWARIVGEAGDVSHALLREVAGTTTLVGESVVARVEAWRLDEELDAVDRTTRGVLASVPGARPATGASTLSAYRVVDDAHRRRVPIELATSESAPGLGAWELSRPDEIAWQVARWRKGR